MDIGIAIAIVYLLLVLWLLVADWALETLP